MKTKIKFKKIFTTLILLFILVLILPKNAGAAPLDPGQHACQTYINNYFPEGGNFDGTMTGVASETAPTIEIGANPSIGRPKIIFTFKLALTSRGKGNINRNYFYFVATDPDYPDLAIRFDDEEPILNYKLQWEKRGLIVDMGRDFDTFEDDCIIVGEFAGRGGYGYDYVYITGTILGNDKWFEFINRIYNRPSGEPEYSITNPVESKFLDVSSDSVLKRWGVKYTRYEQGIIDVVGGAIGKVLNIISTAMASILNWATNKLEPLLEPTDLLTKSAVVQTWQSIRNICMGLFALGLIIIAFANVLRVQLDYYHIKLLLPRLIIAMILVNFSLLMCQILLDFANILTANFINLTNFKDIIPTGNEVFNIGAGIAIGAAVFFIDVALMMIAVVAVLVILFLLLFRVAMLWFLAIISPVMILFMVLPFTRGLYSKWWNSFIKYIFMGPVVALLLMIAAKISGVIGEGDTSNPLSDNLIQFMITVGLIAAAGLVPIMLGDMAMKTVGGALGKAAAGYRKGAFARSKLGLKMAKRQDKQMQKALERRALTIPQRVRGRLEGAKQGLEKARHPIKAWSERGAQGKSYFGTGAAKQGEKFVAGLSEQEQIKAAQRNDIAAQSTLSARGVPWWDESKYNYAKGEQPSNLSGAAKANFIKTRPDIGYAGDNEGLKKHIERGGALTMNGQALTNVLKNEEQSKILNDAAGGRYMNYLLNSANPDQRHAILSHYSENPTQISNLNANTQTLLLDRAMRGHDSNIARNVIKGLKDQKLLEDASSRLKTSDISSWNAETVKGIRDDLKGMLSRDQLMGQWGVHSASGSEGLKDSFHGYQGKDGFTYNRLAKEDNSNQSSPNP